MTRHQAGILFERYADDALCHCPTLRQAERLKEVLTQRLAACKLELHPQKTRIGYCKDGLRRRLYPEYRFDFLGFVRHEVAYTAVMTKGSDITWCAATSTLPSHAAGVI